MPLGDDKNYEDLGEVVCTETVTMTVEGMDMTGCRDKHIDGHTEMIDGKLF